MSSNERTETPVYAGGAGRAQVLFGRSGPPQGFLGASALLVLAIFASAVPTAAGAQGDYLLHGRISFDLNGTMVKGTEDASWAQAATNTLVLPGDTLWVDNGGMTEVEFSGASYLRMADGSKAEVTSLPPSAVIRGWQGSFYVQRLSRSTGSFLLVTPACGIEVEKDTAARVDVSSAGATTVTVRWGRTTVRTDVGSAEFVGSGQRVWVDPGMLPSTPVMFERSEQDAFDTWNQERAQTLAGAVNAIPKTVVISEPTIGAYDLAPYGEWVYVENRPYWRPTVVVDYVPYRYGSWTYVNGCGHVWTGSYPFCYVTSHYGRWHYNSGYGWVWSYDPAWSPAWVATVRCGNYFVWTPVDYYYRPVLAYDSVYFTIGGVPFGIHASTWVLANELYFGPDCVYGVRPDIYQHIYRQPVHIWNIDGRGRPRVRVPYDNSVRQVRDYNPRRSIRAATSGTTGGPSPELRVRRLEASQGRATFSSVGRSGSRNVRTSSSSLERVARVRSVQVSDTYSRATRPSATGGVGATRGGRGSDPRTLRSAEAITRRTVPDRGSNEGSRSDRSRSTRQPTSSEASVERTTRTPVRSYAVPLSSTSRGPATRRSEPVRSRTPSQTPSVRQAPRGGGQPSRTPERPTPPAVRSAPSRSPSSAPSPTRSSPRSSSVVQVPSRTFSPGPTRSSSRTSSNQGMRTRSASPSAPSVSRSAPSAPRASRSAPSRSVPSVSRSAPSVPRVSRPAPSRSAPSVSRSAPSARSRSSAGVGRSAPSSRLSAPSSRGRR